MVSTTLNFSAVAAENPYAWVQRKLSAQEIRTPGPWQEIRLLSGGNQQKVILARWMSGNARTYILDEPTRGIDIGARAGIYRLIQQLAADGAAVVIHAKADDYRTDPSGNSGDRIACGVLG